MEYATYSITMPAGYLTFGDHVFIRSSNAIYYAYADSEWLYIGEMKVYGRKADPDVDFYSFDAQAGDTLDITMTGATLADPRIWLYDAQGNEIAVGLTGSLSRQLTDDGTYYVKAGGTSRYSYGSYGLNVSVTRAAPAASTTIDDPRAMATITIDAAGTPDYLDKRFLYIGGTTLSGENALQVFDVSGVLPRPRLLQTVQGLGQVYGISTGGAEDGLVFVAHRGAGGEGTVSVYRRLADGTITWMHSLGLGVTGTAEAVADMALDVEGDRIYVTDESGQDLTALRFDGTQLSEDSTAWHGQPLGDIVPWLQSVHVSADGQFVYGVNPQLDALLVLRSDSLSFAACYIDGQSGVDGLAGAAAVALSPDGLRVYALAPGDNAVAVFDVVYSPVNTWRLAFVAAIPLDSSGLGDATGDATALAVGTDSLYVGFAGGIARFDSGSFQLLGSAPALGVTSLEANPTYPALYATADGELRRYASDLAGLPQVIGGLPGACDIAVSSDGGTIYAAVAGANAIAAFGESGGALSSTPLQLIKEGQRGVRGLVGVSAIALSPAGDLVFAVGSASDSLVVLKRNPVTGELLFAQAFRNSGELGLESPNSVAAAGTRVFVGSSAGLGIHGGGVASYSRVESGDAEQGYTVSFVDVEELSLTTGLHQDTVRVTDPPSVDLLSIDTGAGADVVNLQGLGARTEIRTGDDEDTILVGSIDAGALLAIDAGAGEDSIFLAGAGADAQVEIHAGPANDVIQIAGAALQNGSPVELFGDDGEDTLLFDPSGQPVDPAAPSTPDGSLKVLASDGGVVDYWSIESVPGFQAATVEAGGDTALSEGQDLILAATATAATNTQIVSLLWDINGDGFFGDAQGATPTVSWEDLVALGIGDGAAQEKGGTRYVVKLRAYDDAGRFAEDEAALTIFDSPPAIAVTAPATVSVGETLTIGLAARDPGDDTIAQWTVDWSDDPQVPAIESFPSDCASIELVCLRTGVHTITLAASDEDGTYTRTISVTVEAPRPDAGGPYSILEGQNLSLQATAPGGPDMAWDLDGDGEYDDAFGAGPFLTWSDLANLSNRIDDDGSYVISVQASYLDISGGVVHMRTADAQLLVSNASPTADFAGAGPVSEGGTITVVFGNQHDASSRDEAAGFGYSYDLDNDGTFDIVDSADPSVSFTAADSGSRIVRGRITDKDGGFSDHLAGVTVYEVAPLIELTGSDSTNEGSPYSLEATVTDPGNDTIVEWVLDWGDGSARETLDGGTRAFAHEFADDGVFDVTLTARDEDGIYIASRTVTVSNVAPVLRIAGVASTEEGSTYTLFLASDDPGEDTILEWTIDWGDGTVDTISGEARAARHVYADDSADEPLGAYRITVTATDEDSPPGQPYAVTQVAALTQPLYAWDEGQGTVRRFYLLTREGLAWRDALLEAEALGGNLAAITSQAEQDFLDDAFVRGVLSPLPLWIGLNDADGDGVLAWASGESLQYANWTIGGWDGLPYIALVPQAGGDFASRVIGFEALPDSVRVYEEGGLLLATDGAALIGAAGHGSRAVASASATDAFTLSLSGGGVFAVRSLDISAPSPQTLRFDGTTPEGTTVSLTFEVGGAGPGTFETISFGSAFLHLVSLTWTPGSTVVDNVEITGTPSLWAGFTDEQWRGIVELGSISGLPFVAAGVLPVVVENVAPSIPMSGAAAVSEGEIYVLSLGVPSDPGADTVTRYLIDWGDAEELVDAPAPGVDGFVPALSVSHVYSDGEAAYEISVTLIDEDGSYESPSRLAVVVENVAPLAQLSGASSADEGSQYTLSIGDPYDPGVDTVTEYVVHWGDGSVESFAQAGEVDHVYYGAAERVITLDLVDEDGVYLAVDSLSLTVKDAPPSIILAGASEVVEGAEYALVLGEATDPGQPGVVVEVEEYIVHWGDGATESFTEAGAVLHTWLEGPFQHVITVDLVVGGTLYSNAGRLGISVRNAPPVILSLESSASGTSTALPVEDVIVTGTFEDPGILDTHTSVIDWGDGTVEPAVVTQGSGSGTLTGSHKYTYSGFYDIRVTVTDDDGASDSEGTLAIISGVGIIDGVLYIAGTPGADHVVVSQLSYPISYWSMNEGSGHEIGDSAGEPQDGWLYSPWPDRDDAGPSEAPFDAQTGVDFHREHREYIAVAHDEAFELSEGTIQFWFKSDKGGRQAMLSKDGWGTGAGGLTIWLVDSRVEVRLESEDGSTTIKSCKVVDRSGWNHLAFSFGPQGMKLYVNGELVGENGYQGGLEGNREPLVLGGSIAGNKGDSADLSRLKVTDFFDGSLDEAAIYGEQLAEEQIRRLITDGPARVASGRGTVIEVRADFIDNEEHTKRFNVADIEAIVVLLGDGDDTAEIGAEITLPLRMYGGKGDDRLVAGSGDSELYGNEGDDRIAGGPGNDTIDGGEGDDVLLGGAGNDRLYGGPGNDVLIGGAGDDVLDGGEGTDTTFGDALLPISCWSMNEGSGHEIGDSAGRAAGRVAVQRGGRTATTRGRRRHRSMRRPGSTSIGSTASTSRWLTTRPSSCRKARSSSGSRPTRAAARRCSPRTAGGTGMA